MPCLPSVVRSVSLYFGFQFTQTWLDLIFWCTVYTLYIISGFVFKLPIEHRQAV